jgi:hypothetical protein
LSGRPSATSSRWPWAGRHSRPGTGLQRDRDRGEGAIVTASVLRLPVDPAGRRRSLKLRFAIVGVLAAIGLLLAIMNATSREWWWANVSTLGIDPGADIYFNLTMVALGFVFPIVAIPMRRQLADARDSGLMSSRWAAAYRAGVGAIPIAFVAIGLFHIGGKPLHHMIHNAAGFSIPLIVMAMMLTVHWAVPALGSRFSIRTLAVDAVIVALFVLAAVQVISYSLMEILGFIICWAWLLPFSLRLEDQVDRARPATPSDA